MKDEAAGALIKELKPKMYSCLLDGSIKPKITKSIKKILLVPTIRHN